MTILPILIAPNPTLRKKAEKVTVFDAKLRQLCDDMLETMYDAPGIGLAAPQIGILQRIVVTDCSDENEKSSLVEAKSNPKIFINPHILEKTDKITSYDEGCLSLPSVEIAVKRENSVLIQYQDLEGRAHNETFSGMQARCLMHEIDHLNGVLIVDYTSQLTRSRILRELRNQKKFG